MCEWRGNLKEHRGKGRKGQSDKERPCAEIGKRNGKGVKGNGGCLHFGEEKERIGEGRRERGNGGSVQRNRKEN